MADEICRLCSEGIVVLVLPTIGNGLEAKVHHELKGCPKGVLCELETIAAPMKVGGRVSPDGSVIYLVRNRWYLVTGLRYGSQMVVLLCPTTTLAPFSAGSHKTSHFLADKCDRL